MEGPFEIQLRKKKRLNKIFQIRIRLEQYYERYWAKGSFVLNNNELD